VIGDLVESVLNSVLTIKFCLFVSGSVAPLLKYTRRQIRSLRHCRECDVQKEVFRCDLCETVVGGMAMGIVHLVCDDRGLQLLGNPIECRGCIRSLTFELRNTGCANSSAQAEQLGKLPPTRIHRFAHSDPQIS